MKPVRNRLGIGPNIGSFTPSTFLYQDVLDYLDRRGIPSITGIFDDYNESTNPYVIDFDEETESESNITEPRRMPMLPIQIEGPGDGPRGIGLFGNLEPGSKRTVLVDGVPTEVYKNITTGLLQTLDGKNVKGDVTETGAYDYEFEASKGAINPMNVGGISAFSRTGRVDTAIQQAAIDKAAREEAARKAREEAARRAQEEARQRAEVERMRQQNEREGRGGYQSDFAQDRDFMGGSGGSDEMGSF